MTTNTCSNWTRVTVFVGFLGVICGSLAFAGDLLEKFLRWFDWLAPVPGLSGLLILALFPITCLVVLLLLSWVFEGFRSNR